MQKPKRYYWWQRYHVGTMEKVWLNLSPEAKDRLAQMTNRVYGGTAVYICIGCIIVFFTPLDILSYSWAKKIVAMTASVTPVILNVPSQSPIPDVVRFYFGVTWLIMPFFIVWEAFWCNYGLKQRVNDLFIKPNMVKSLIKSRVFAVLSIVAFTLILAGFFDSSITDLYKISSRQSRMLWQSRYTLLVAGALTNLVFVIGIPMAITSIHVIAIVWSYLPWLRRRKHS
jgi:hypothetical protein